MVRSCSYNIFSYNSLAYSFANRDFKLCRNESDGRDGEDDQKNAFKSFKTSRYHINLCLNHSLARSFNNCLRFRA